MSKKMSFLFMIVQNIWTCPKFQLHLEHIVCNPKLVFHKWQYLLLLTMNDYIRCLNVTKVICKLSGERKLTVLRKKCSKIIPNQKMTTYCLFSYDEHRDPLCGQLFNRRVLKKAGYKNIMEGGPRSCLIFTSTAVVAMVTFERFHAWGTY